MMFANGFRRIFHFHLKKCGGTSMNSWLDWHTSDDRSWETLRGFLTLSPPDVERRKAWSVVSGFQASVIHSHVPLMEDLRPHTFCFTMLREPVARLVSQFADWRRESGTRHKTNDILSSAIVDAGSMSLGAFLEKYRQTDVRRVIDNYQVRALSSGIRNLKSNAPCDRAMLNRALASMNEKFHLVGLTERMDDTMNMLSSRLGLVPGGLNGVRRNVTNAANVSASEIAQAEGLLLELTEYDRELYAAAKARFEHDFSKHEPYGEAEFERLHAAEAVEAPQAIYSTIDVMYSVRQRLNVSGIHGRDGPARDDCAVWTGPGCRSVIYMPAPIDRPITVMLRVRGYSDIALRSEMRFELDDVPCSHNCLPAEGLADLVTIEARSNRPFIKLAIILPFTAPHELDIRSRGIAFDGYGWTYRPPVQQATLATVPD